MFKGKILIKIILFLIALLLLLVGQENDFETLKLILELSICFLDILDGLSKVIRDIKNKTDDA